MEIIWDRGNALVKDVHRELYKRKGLAYTTVMTEMTQMYRKGVLSHSRKGRAYVYTPRLSRREALEGNLEDFVTDFFHGSTEEFARFIGKDPTLIAKKPSREAKAPERESFTPLEPQGMPLEKASPQAAPLGDEEDVTLL